MPRVISWYTGVFLANGREAAATADPSTEAGVASAWCLVWTDRRALEHRSGAAACKRRQILDSGASGEPLTRSPLGPGAEPQLFCIVRILGIHPQSSTFEGSRRQGGRTRLRIRWYRISCLADRAISLRGHTTDPIKLPGPAGKVQPGYANTHARIALGTTSWSERVTYGKGLPSPLNGTRRRAATGERLVYKMQH
jgi:hypothetical protein